MSPETQALGELLERYPRRVLSHHIQSATSIDELLSALDHAQLKEERRYWAGKGVGKGAPGIGESKGELVGVYDPGFPPLLREIPDPPLILHVRGNLDCLATPAVAVVGARRCTSQGRALAERFAKALGECGLTIVSGLALGIDAHAHRGTLAGRGTTIACLGSGLDRIYPRSHERLVQQIVSAGGLLLSEYSPEVSAKPFHFPERNRIISGLCLGTLVVEASEKSGSLITARMALEQGRDVFVLPGPVDSLVSGGCHRLIREGAELVVTPEQIIESLGLERRQVSVSQIAPSSNVLSSNVSREQRYLLELCSGYARDLGELMALTGWDTTRLMRMLGELELLGIVRQTTDGYIASS